MTREFWLVWTVKQCEQNLKQSDVCSKVFDKKNILIGDVDTLTTYQWTSGMPLHAPLNKSIYQKTPWYKPGQEKKNDTSKD